MADIKQPILGEIQPEKSWDELTDAEKIERMHGVVHSLQMEVGHLEQQVYRLESHEHGQSGSVLVSINTYGLDAGVPPGGDKDRWF